MDLDEHEPAWLRLRALREIGTWTVEKLALEGQGRDDMLPAGDLAYIKLVGRLAGLGRRATEDEVREFFAPYAPFEGLAGTYVIAGRRDAAARRDRRAGRRGRIAAGRGRPPGLSRPRKRVNWRAGPSESHDFMVFSPRPADPHQPPLAESPRRSNHTAM